MHLMSARWAGFLEQAGLLGGATTATRGPYENSLSVQRDYYLGMSRFGVG